MATILITGGSGLIGTHLTAALKTEGHSVRWMSRKAGTNDGVQAYAWELVLGTMDEAALEGVDHIVHLAGAGIADKRWSKARVQELIDSRTQGSELLFRVCERCGQWPKSFISAAGIGYYGAVTSAHVYTEDDAPGTDTIARISVAWEEAVDKWKDRTRVVKLRTSVVLAHDAGALKSLGRIVRFGLAAPIGSGLQVMPWIHIDALVSAYRLALNDDRLRGAYNVASSDQPDNRRFMRTLAEVLHRPFILPSVPGFALRLLVGDVADVLLNGSAVSGRKLEAAGFTAHHRELREALADLYR
ncbi:MAG: TIGR01777 family oxidoreductase [Flavobacteriales bacterium]|nr:TIGR01777 family oxidoreductase [Flavobacteriales bacterium]